MDKPVTKDVQSKKTFSTDTCMKNLARAFVGDCRTVMGTDYKRDWEDLLETPAKLREYKFPDRFQTSPYHFKMEAQLENLFKRYQFEADMYTPRELERLSFEKFSALQKRLGAHDWSPITHRAFLVVQKARVIVGEILRGTDPSTLGEFCRFSSKATIGNTARDAYIDHKLADPITGSQEHCEWFKTHLSTNDILFETLCKCSPSGLPVLQQCESLTLVGVPKSYKSLRLIMPNTLIGSYYTYGLGKLLVGALRTTGLDIRDLQSIHKALAQRASTTKKLVTADMSAASESFLWSLVCRMLPRKWLRAVRLGRVSHYNVGKRRFFYCSFMAMGIGYTFPLQTLLFYALVKATCMLLGVNGLVSVYGDDLIYPYKAHHAVTTVLTDLGMVLNREKTFVNVDFRESCGGDYYRGVDVRPFSPEGSTSHLSGRRYEAWLYQLVNGLQLRWDRDSLPKTFAFLESEISRVTPRIKQVPPSFPDTSGIRTAAPIFHPLYSPVLIASPCDSGPVPFVGKRQASSPLGGSQSYIFEHLTKVSKNRFVCFEQAYLYDWLRSRQAGEESEVFDSVYLAVGFDKWLRYEFWHRKQSVSKWFSEGRPALKLFPLPKQPRNYRSSDGKRLKRCIATSSCKLTPERIQTTRTDSISDWI